MPLYDDPPHRVNVFTTTSATEAGGGVAIIYVAGQTSIPASINTASASEVELFAVQGLQVSHTVAILSSALTTPIVRGMKLTDESGLSYHVEGIRSGRAYGNIPAFTYVQCREILGT